MTNKFLQSTVIALILTCISTASMIAYGASNVQIVSTTITDNQFALNTVWYHITMTDKQYYWHSDSDSDVLTLSETDGSFDDAYLWCFVGDVAHGYTIYNKAAGTAKALAISDSSVRLAESGSNLFLTDASEVESMSDVSNIFFAATTTVGGNKLSDVGGKVGISSQSTANEVLVINFAQQMCQVSPKTGYLYRTDGNTTSSWKNFWISNDDENFTLSSSYNNMSTNGESLYIASGTNNSSWDLSIPDGRIITSYEFVANIIAEDDDVTVTGNNGNNVMALTVDKQTFKVDNISSLAQYNFTVTGNNNKYAVISDFYVNMRRGSLDRPQSHDVFPCTTEAIDTAAYRIPALTCVENGPHKGRLIAVNDFRVSGTDDIGYGVRIDLHISTSDDNGNTWTTPACAKNAAGEFVTQGEGTPEVEGDSTDDSEDSSEKNSNYRWKCAFGDACIVSDRESGKILMMSVGGPVGFFRSTRYNPNQLVRWYSTDGGDTWTDAECITDYILDLFDDNCPWGCIYGQFIGSGRMMQSHYIKQGEYYRIYAVNSVLTPDCDTANYVLYSDDFGATWHILGDAQNPPVYVGADEPKAEELPDGSVLLAARNQSGNRNFNIFRYTDIAAGQGVWDSNVTTNCGQGSINACNGEIMILPAVNNETAEQTYLALQTMPYGNSRKNVSIIFKSLNGFDDINRPASFSTWEGRYQVTQKASAYSAICWQKDNTLGLLYEEDTYDKVYNGVYVNLSLETITYGKYSYCENIDESVRQTITQSVIDGRLATEVNCDPGIYVGQPNGEGNNAAIVAAEAYAAAPSYASYVAFNKAMVDGSKDATIQVVDKGIYQIISAHNGQYSFTEDKYLTVSGSSLAVTEMSMGATEWILISRGSDAYAIYNVISRKYIANTPELYDAVPTTTDASQAGLYTINSTIDGFSALICTAPTETSYPAIHMNSSAAIVPWTSSAAASKWYLSYVGDGSNLVPDNDLVIDITTDSAVPVSYYDLMGRRVVSPSAGHIYITSDHKIVKF